MVTSKAEVFIESLIWQKHLPNYDIIIQAAVKVLDPEFAKLSPDTTVSIVLADDKFIESLNLKYRGKQKPTNVLSFPARDPKDPIQTPELGDIVLAYETIVAEAKDQGKSVAHHLQHLIIHGFLHLLGYEHESEDEATIMETLEIQLLEKLGIPNPYDAVHQSTFHA